MREAGQKCWASTSKAANEQILNEGPKQAPNWLIAQNLSFQRGKSTRNDAIKQGDGAAAQSSGCGTAGKENRARSLRPLS